MWSSFLGRFSKFGNRLKQMLNPTDKSVITIKDENGNILVNVAIQIKRDNYTYVAVSDYNGRVTLVGRYARHYEVTLAKTDKQQYQIADWVFSSSATLTYPQAPKTTLDGMFAGTDPRMYVNIWDGGTAVGDFTTILVQDGNGNALPNTVIEIRSGDYRYATITDDEGYAMVSGIIGDSYDVILAKADEEQYIISGWTFGSDTLTYPQTAKVTWDGMYADTDTRMYVNAWDGGFA